MITIHHGQGVEDFISETLENSFLVAPVYRDLKTNEVKDLVQKLSVLYPQESPSLIAGPLDLVRNTDVLDILLKIIEEPVGNAQLILFAHDYGSVPPTIRSRCSEKFHYKFQARSEFYDQGSQLLKCLLNRDISSLMGLVRKMDRKDVANVVNGYMEVLVEEDLIGRFYDLELREIVSTGSRSHLCTYFLERL